MTKRKKGQVPYESEHPTRPWTPDVPGHRQRRSGSVNDDSKRELNRQIEDLEKELKIGSGSERVA